MKVTDGLVAREVGPLVRTAAHSVRRAAWGCGVRTRSPQALAAASKRPSETVASCFRQVSSQTEQSSNLRFGAHHGFAGVSTSWRQAVPAALLGRDPFVMPRRILLVVLPALLLPVLG